MTQYRGAVGLLACAMLALVGCSGETKLAFTAQPASTFSGETLAPVVVELQDGDGKGVDAAGTVTLKLVGEGARLEGTLSVAASGGRATFTDLRVEGGAEGLALEASVTDGEDEGVGAKSEGFGVEAVKLRFAGMREAYRADLPLDAFSVELVSAKDGRVLPVSRAVTLGVGNNPTGAVLAGAEATAVAGKATFTALQVDRAGQGYTLVATARSAESGTSSAFTLRHALDEREPKDKAAAGAQLNDTPESAEPIVVGLPVFGDLSPSALVAGGDVQNDVDYLRFSARAGELLEVATYATRLDQAHWKQGIKLTLVAAADLRELFRVGSDETTAEEVDYGLKQVRIPADGDYLLRLEPQDAAVLDGGRYAAWVQLSGAPALLQLEAETAAEGGGNDSLEDAEPLAPGMLYGYYEGLSTPAEGDSYKFVVDGPTRVRFALTAHRNGLYLPAEREGWYDPELLLYDAEGQELQDNDDTFYYDSSLEQLLPAGTYYVRVTRCCGTGAAPYFLSYSAQAVQPVAQPATNTVPEQAMAISYGQYVGGEMAAAEETRWFKFAAKAGDMVELYPFEDAVTSESSANVSLALFAADDLVNSLDLEVLGVADVHRTILVKDGEYLVRLTAGSPGSFTFLLQRFSGAAFETEGATAPSAFDAQGWAAGVIGDPEDTDSFSVPADAGQLVSVSLYAGWANEGDAYSSWGSSLSPMLQILDAQGSVLATAKASETGYAESLNRSGSTMELSFRAPARGTYTLVVSSDGGSVVVARTGRVSALGVVAPVPYDASAYYAVQLWKGQ